MKARLLAISAFAVLLSGCWQYGSGELVGYVYATEDGLFWDKVWVKSTLESSESDCLIIEDGSPLKDELAARAGEGKMRIRFDLHFAAAADCLSDQVTSYETL